MVSMRISLVVVGRPRLRTDGDLRRLVHQTSWYQRLVEGRKRKTAWVEVNGMRGEVVPYSDYFFNQRYALFGASHPDGDYFRGDIRSLRVIPR